MVIQLQSKIEGITLTEQVSFQHEFTIGVTLHDSWWETIGAYDHQKTIEPYVIKIGLSNIDLMSHELESIWPMGSMDHIITEICE
jgi:hypothetical protein